MEGVALSITPFHYLCTVAVLDPNNAGAGKTVVGDWLLDNTGYPFIITNIVSGGRIEVYDVNERGNVYGRQGPYNGRMGYVYRPTHGGFMLTSAQLRFLDPTARDVINGMEKAVQWMHRGMEILGVDDTLTAVDEENITKLNLSSDFKLTNENAGWQGGKAFDVDINYTNETPMPEKVLSIAKDTTFDNVPIHSMLTKILYPYQIPSFSAFTMASQSTVLECGVKVTGGVRTFNWTNINKENITPNSIVIKDHTANTILKSSIGIDDITANINIGSDITKTTTATLHYWRIIGTPTQGTDFYRNFSVIWYTPFYYGVGAAGLNVSQIQGLTKDISVKGEKKYEFNPQEQKMYFAYEANYGDLVKIEDINGFDITNSFAKRVESFTTNAPNYAGVTKSYNVYESIDLATPPEGVYENTFKF